MAQWWNTPMRLIGNQGNYGTVTGDNHAAARYIEAYMNHFSYDNFFKEWSPNITEFIPNYTNDALEPEYLPSAFPIILCKNISGLGYGMSTGIPYYCPNEVVDAMIKLIDNPKYKPVLIPDSPTGCPIVDNDWQQMAETGYGNFIFRGESVIEGNKIRIKSIPHITSTAAIIKRLKDAVEAKKLDGIVDMIDFTDEHDDSADIDLHIIVKKGFSPEQLLDRIYKMTDLQTTSVVKLDVVYDYENFHLSLKALMMNWIEYRRETKRRFITSEYSSIRRKLHLLEAIILILEKYGEDRLLEIGKKSKNRTDMINNLIKEFKLTEIQAESLAEMKFYNLSRDNMAEYKSDLKKYTKLEKEAKKALIDDDMVDKMIKDELLYFKEKYGIARKSKIIPATTINEIPDSKHFIAITHNGYVKKLDAGYTTLGEIKEGDSIKYLMKANNRDSLLIFDETGIVYGLDVHKIPSTGKKAGVKINTLIGLNPDKTKVVSVLTKPNEKEIESSEKLIYMLTTSKDGYIKKTIISNYSNVGTKGIIGTTLADGDRLVDAKIIKGDKEIILYTGKGNYIKFNTEEFTDTGRATRGVLGIKLASSDSVVGCDILQKTKNYVIIVTNKGNGKKCLLRNFDCSKRGSAGNTLIKLKKGESILSVTSGRNGNNLEIYTLNGKQTIPVADIPELLKLGEGKQIIKLEKKDVIMNTIVS